MKGFSMKYGQCRCGNKLTITDYYNKQSTCSKCRQEASRQISMESKIREVEDCGFDVVSYTWNREHQMKVKCQSCGRYKISYYKNIVKAGRKCVCKYPKHMEKLMLSKQIRDVIIKIPNSYKVSGIYKITIGDKFYIGSAKNIQNRLRSHVRGIRDGNHVNRLILKAYDEIVSLEFELVETTSKLVEREQYYIDTMKPTLNISPTAGNPMRDFRHFNKVVGEWNSNSNYSDELIHKVVTRLVDTKDLKKVSDEFNIGYHTVSGITSGKIYTWLGTDEYNKVISTKGSRFGYSQIVDILTRLSNGEHQKDIAVIYNSCQDQISKIKLAKGRVYQNLKENDMTIRGLYKKINGGVL